MVIWTLEYSKLARKDAKKLSKSGLRAEAESLLGLLETDPYAEPPPYKELKGDLSGILSRRISYQHRLTYKVFDEEQRVRILSMWTHYHE